MLRPPGTFVPPTNAGTHAETRARLLAAEQRPTPPVNVPRFCITAALPAPLTGGEPRETGRWWPWRGAVDLEYVTIDMRSVTSPTSVSIRRGGVDVVTAELADDGTIRQGVDVRWTIGDYLDLTVEGAAGHVLVQMWFRGEGGGGLVFSVPAGGGG